MICVSVQERSFDACKTILQENPMAELRADLCSLPVEQTAKLVAMHQNLIFTCRMATTGAEAATEQFISAIKRGAKYIDIEIEAPLEYAEPLMIYAKESGTKLIISYHNYQSTPSFDELCQIAQTCLRRGADIIKIVTTANSVADVTRVMRLYGTYQPNRLVAFAMGALGKFSRYLSLRLGAPYTYASYGKNSKDSEIKGEETAPGQYNVTELKSLLEREKSPLNFTLKNHHVNIPCSKSVAQRAIIASLFTQEGCLLKNFEPCNDITGALNVASGLGAKVIYGNNGEVRIESGGVEAIKKRLRERLDSLEQKKIELNIGESGLLTRLLLPTVAYLTEILKEKESVKVVGSGSILGRNLKEAANVLSLLGVECKTNKSAEGKGAYLPFEISGKMAQNSDIEIDGSESSQSVSGLLMTLPLLPYNTKLRVKNPASLPYIELTLNLLKSFSVNIKSEITKEAATFFIEGGAKYKAESLYLESDWSSASFFAVLYAISSMKQKSEGGSAKEYKLLNMPLQTSQADRAILDILKLSGVEVKIEERGAPGDIIIDSPPQLSSFTFDATNAPDLFPIAALYATFCKGVSKIKGVSRLLEKESNRAESIYAEYTILGADIEIDGDYMYIKGGALHGGAVESHNDHRIAMSLVVASLFINSPVEIDDLKCIDKSFPSFLTKL